MAFEIDEAFAVATQRAGGEEAIVGGLYEVGPAGSECGDRNESGLGAYFVSTEEIQPVEFVGGDEAFDFVEESERIEWAEFWFEPVGDEPHGVTVCFPRLRSAGLAEVRLDSAFAEGHKFLNVRAHAAGEADEDFEVWFYARLVGCLADELEIAVGVGDGAGFLVEACNGEDDVGHGGSFREKHVLHYNELVFERSQVDGAEFERVGADDEEGCQRTTCRRRQHLRLGQPDGVRHSGVFICECINRAYGYVAGQPVGEEAHIGGAARIGMIAEVREANIAAAEAPGYEFIYSCSAILLTEDDQEIFFLKERFTEVGVVDFGLFAAQVFRERGVGACGEAKGRPGLAFKLDLALIDDV